MTWYRIKIHDPNWVEYHKDCGDWVCKIFKKRYGWTSVLVHKQTGERLNVGVSLTKRLAKKSCLQALKHPALGDFIERLKRNKALISRLKGDE